VERLAGLLPAIGLAEGGHRALLWLGIALAQGFFVLLLLIEPFIAVAVLGSLLIFVVALRYPVVAAIAVMAARLAANRSLSIKIGPMFLGIFEPLYVVAFVAICIRIVQTRRNLLHAFPAWPLMAALVAWIAISLTWSANKPEGVVVLIRITYEVGLVWLLASMLRTPRRFHTAIWTWLLVGSVVGVAGVLAGTSGTSEAIYGDVAFQSMSSGGRLGGLGQHPNWFGMSMAFGICPAIAMAYVEPSRLRKLILVGIAGILLMAAVSTGSRGAVWGAGVGSLFLALNSQRLRRFLYRWWVVIAIVFVGALLFGAGPLTSAVFRVLTRGIDTFWQGNTRFANWDACMRMFTETFGMGIGAGGYLEWLPRFNERLLLSDSAYPHGIGWEVMAHWGAIGMGLLLAIGITIGKFYVRTLRRVRGTVLEMWLIGMAAGVIGYWAHSLVEFHLIDKPFWAFFGVSLALLVAASKVADDPEELERYRIHDRERA
jgi:hypothetical protein